MKENSRKKIIHNIYKNQMDKNKFNQRSGRFLQCKLQITHEGNQQGNKNLGSYLCLWIRRVNIIKILTLHKAVYRFNTVTIKISRTLFTELKSDPEIHEIKKRPRLAKGVYGDLGGRVSQPAGITRPAYKTYYKAIYIKITQYW